MTAVVLCQHFGDDALGEMEEAKHVHRCDQCIVFGRVADEGLGDEDTGVVDQRVDAAEPHHRFENEAFGSSGVGDIAWDAQDFGMRRVGNGASWRSPGSRACGMPRPSLHRFHAMHR